MGSKHGQRPQVFSLKNPGVEVFVTVNHSGNSRDSKIERRRTMEEPGLKL